jgi:hypothetical protein
MHSAPLCTAPQRVAAIQSTLPGELLLEAASVVRSPFAPLPSGHDNSLGTVLAQVCHTPCSVMVHLNSIGFATIAPLPEPPLPRTL